MWRIWIVLGLGVSACADFPEVDAALASGSASRDYPALLPFEDLLAAPEARVSATDEAALLARAEALRNRADGLRGPVIDRATRDRMAGGVTQP